MYFNWFALIFFEHFRQQIAQTFAQFSSYNLAFSSTALLDKNSQVQQTHIAEPISKELTGVQACRRVQWQRMPAYLITAM